VEKILKNRGLQLFPAYPNAVCQQLEISYVENSYRNLQVTLTRAPIPLHQSESFNISEHISNTNLMDTMLELSVKQEVLPLHHRGCSF
jgi:hypothetical protein